MSSYKALHLEQGEEVILEVRRHWIVFAGNILVFIISIILPLVGFLWLMDYFKQYSQFFSGIYFSLFLFFYTLWFLFSWIGFFIAWTKFYLDVWYVTGTRIIDIEQEKIFYRNVSNLRFDKIQDITVEVHGFIATFLNFGDIRVQTASENENDFLMRSVKDPEKVKRIIFAQHNIIGDKYSREL